MIFPLLKTKNNKNSVFCFNLLYFEDWQRDSVPDYEIRNRLQRFIDLLYL